HGGAESLLHHAEHGCAVGEDRRLRIVRQGEILSTSVPHHVGERSVECSIDLLQGGRGGGKLVGQVARHSRLLRSLPREQQHCHHRSTTLPHVKPAPNVTSITIIPSRSLPSSRA